MTDQQLNRGNQIKREIELLTDRMKHVSSDNRLPDYGGACVGFSTESEHFVIELHETSKLNQVRLLKDKIDQLQGEFDKL